MASRFSTFRDRVQSETRTSRSDDRSGYNHSLGSIIWMALVRLSVTMFVAWYLRDHIVNFNHWWVVASLAIYGIAIYPAQIQYEYFRQNNKKLIEQTLCSSCRHFRPENLHCTKLDEHISERYLPCEGEEWEPDMFSFDVEREE